MHFFKLQTIPLFHGQTKRKPHIEKTRGEFEAEICNAVIKFQKEYMGRGPLETKAYIIDDMVLVRLKNVLTKAELKLAESTDRKNGSELIKWVRIALLEQGRPLLEAVVQDIVNAGIKSLIPISAPLPGSELFFFRWNPSPVIRKINSVRHDEKKDSDPGNVGPAGNGVAKRKY